MSASPDPVGTPAPTPVSEPLRARGASPRLAAMVVVGAALAVVAVGALERPPVPPDAARSPRAVAVASPSVRSTPRPSRSPIASLRTDERTAPLAVTAPAPGASVTGDSVRVRGNSARPHAPLRVAVAVGRLELGVVHLKADHRGGFEGRVPLLPRPRSTPATLWLHEAASSFLLAEVPIRLAGAAAVSIWSPRAGETVDGMIEISGCALPGVRGVTASTRVGETGVGTEVILRLPDDPVAGACRSFDVLLPLQTDVVVGRTVVHVSWRLHGVRATYSREIPVRVVAADR